MNTNGIRRAMGCASAVGLRMLGVLILAAGVAGCDASRAQSMTTLADGLSRFEGNDHITALRLFERAASQDPTNAQAHYLVGLVHLQTYHDAQAALEPLSRAASLSPDDAEVMYQYGLALTQVGARAQAIEALESAVSSDPDHARGLYRLGNLRFQDGDILGAISTYTRAIHADPTLEQAWNALGNLYFDHGRPQEALAVFENAIRINPESTMNRADIGRIYLALDEPDAAIGYLRQAAERAGAPASVHYNLGVSLRTRFEQTGRPSDREDAITSLRRALGQCNAAAERARCSSIQSMIRELERSTD